MNNYQRRGASFIELLIVLGIMLFLFWITMNMLTGSGKSGTGSGSGSASRGGAMGRAKRVLQQFDLNQVYKGFVVWSMTYNDQYPSTKNSPQMEGDLSHQVFKVLLEDGVIVGQQLISRNEFVTGFDIGYASSFGPNNTSFALPDYDAENWLRARNWSNTNDLSYVLISDRWVDDPIVPTSMRNLQSDETDPGYWNILFNDGHSGKTGREPALPNGDRLFERDENLKRRDTLMVHD